MTREVLADTSVFIAMERDIPDISLGSTAAVSVITIGELRAGVFLSSDPAMTSRRLRTLLLAEQSEPIPIDIRIADTWSELHVARRRMGRPMPLNDSWIAATALTVGLPVMTMDADFDDTPGLEVIRI